VGLSILHLNGRLVRHHPFEPFGARVRLAWTTTLPSARGNDCGTPTSGQGGAVARPYSPRDRA
jgi:hypothetical protein